MKSLANFAASLGILSVCLAATPGFTQSQQSTAPTLPNNAPNTTFNVARKSGNCPNNIKIWNSFRSYEGGGEHTVIADTANIAGAAKLSSSGAKFVEFTAPLKSNFASCVGSASSASESLYKFQFRNKNLVFRMDLSGLPSGAITKISYKGVVSNRPAIKWAIAD